MSQIVLYKTYTIRSMPILQLNTGQWRIEASIAWERAGVVTERPFTLETICQTEQEADIHGITYGERIIDGKIPGLSME